jgi:hypothetical protein
MNHTSLYGSPRGMDHVSMKLALQSWHYIGNLNGYPRTGIRTS